jgi:hypothetical protein
MLPFRLTISLTWLVAVTDLQAASLRCPMATVGVGLAEAALINSLWTDLGGPSMDASNGPLGCPIDDAKPITDSGWSGIQQRFQRGTILVGNGGSAGFDVAAVRGVGGWFVWWRVPASMNFGDYLIPSEKTPSADHGSSAPKALWSHGGFLQTAGQTGTVALWRCSGSPCTWQQATPVLTGFSRPFDAAAVLDLTALSQPDVSRFSARVAAAFPPWLPCYTLIPVNDPKPGEDTIARATLMMRGSSPCEITRVAPASVVNLWLATFQFPSDQKPGTDSDNFWCSRHGDLDITLVQLLHLVFQHPSSFSTATMNNVHNILSPWGGAPRKDAYVTPDGTCEGFGVVETENHIILQETARYLINALLGNPDGSNRDWLLRFMQQIARRDFYEFNSIPYTRYHIKALYALHDYAPDPEVRTAARGLLIWLFTKQAISGNMDRDHRPFRRRPEKKRYASVAWWGDATTATTAQLALLAGPWQHVHQDIDLELDRGRDNVGDPALFDLVTYPELGAAGENFLAEFIDVADTSLVLPDALKGWLQRRFTDPLANRVTYVQALRHNSPIADDHNLFAQSNSGVEIVSGNRNWTIIGGGVNVAPGDPGPPPGGTGWTIGGAVAGAAAGAAVGSAIGGAGGAVIGAAVGGIIGAFGTKKTADQIAADKQHDTLWGDQPGILRETTLISSPVGLNRAQTVRFFSPVVTSEGANLLPRICVAEGFMCGFDLQMPAHPFPNKDAASCPITFTFPGPLASVIPPDSKSRSAVEQLGCLLQPVADVRGWTTFVFEHGTLVIGTGDPAGSERFAAVWIQDDDSGRNVHVQWRLPGQFHDWYNVHVYTTAVAPKSGDAPGGDILYANSGDPTHTDTFDKGQIDKPFSLKDVPDTDWHFLLEACDPTYTLGIRDGHKCTADIFPRLDLTVAPPPNQPFSCDAHTSHQMGLVMESGGSCSLSPYGLFSYVFVQPCNRDCPNWANNFGFVVVSPSRGWTSTDFAAIVESSIASFRSSSGHDYQPVSTISTVDVPISPPVKSSPTPFGPPVWKATGMPTAHTVSFRWVGQNMNQSLVLADSGAASALYSTLAKDWTTWPTARGHISSPDFTAFGPEFVHSSGTGCFTVSGLPTSAMPTPRSVRVDLRSASTPVIDEPSLASLPALCP